MYMYIVYIYIYIYTYIYIYIHIHDARPEGSRWRRAPGTLSRGAWGAMSAKATVGSAEEAHGLGLGIGSRR